MLIIPNHLPLLQVIVPLIAAAVCILVSNYMIVLLIVSAVVITSLMITISIMIKLSQVKVISYALGDWLPPFGIEYRVDYLTILLLFIITLVMLFTFIDSIRSLKNDITKKQLPLFYSLFLLCFAGFLGMVMTNDIFNIYVFLEIASLASYGLIAMGNNKKALIVSFQYLIIGSIAALFILLGICLLYMMSGTLNMADLSYQLQDKMNLVPVKYGIICIIIGLLLKMAFFPLHFWLTNLYVYAPSSVGAFLAGITSKVSLYLLLRVIFNIIGYQQFHDNFYELLFSLKILSYFALIIGGVFAILSTNLRKILAFSTISQLGFMLVAIVSNLDSISVLFLLILSHSITKMTLLMAQEPTQNIESHFITKLCIIFNVANLIGLPLTLGFAAKWSLLSAFIKHADWISFIIITLGGIITAWYSWKVVNKKIYKNPVIIAATLFNIALALNAKYLIYYSEIITNTLLKGYY